MEILSKNKECLTFKYINYNLAENKQKQIMRFRLFKYQINNKIYTYIQIPFLLIYFDENCKNSNYQV